MEEMSHNILNISIILFLGALFLVQTANAAPTDCEKNLVDEFEIRTNIITAAVDELFELDNIVKEKGKTLLLDVLNDSKVRAIENDVMEKARTAIREYADQLDFYDKNGWDKKSKVFETLQFEHAVKVGNATPETEVVSNALKEHGLEDLEKILKDHLNEFSKKFAKQIDEFVGNLSEEEKLKEKEFLDWYKKFVAETDFYEKLKIFEQFFDSMNDSNSSERFFGFDSPLIVRLNKFYLSLSEHYNPKKMQKSE